MWYEISELSDVSLNAAYKICDVDLENRGLIVTSALFKHTPLI